MAPFEVVSGPGRSLLEILQQEILNVRANRFMTEPEKQLKIRKLENEINNSRGKSKN